MNIKRIFSEEYLTWDEYKGLVYTIEFIRELNQAIGSSEIKRIGGD